MGFKRFEAIDDSIVDQWQELTIRQQRREVEKQLSGWEESVEFRDVVEPALRSIAKQLAEVYDDQTVDQFKTELFEAFEAGVYDAQLGRERYSSLG